MIRPQKQSSDNDTSANGNKVTKPAEDQDDIEKAPLLSPEDSDSSAPVSTASSKKDISDVWMVAKQQSCITKVLPFTQVEGNSFLVYGTRRGSGVAFPAHCIMGPDFCCSFFTTSLIISANLYWFSLAFKHNLNKFYTAGGIFFGLALLISYSKTAYSDPGIVKKLTREEFLKLPKQSDPVCRVCNIYRPIGSGRPFPSLHHLQLCRCLSGTRHCYDCNACIEDHDHHWYC